MALDRLFGQIFEIARSLASNEPARPSSPPPPSRPSTPPRPTAGTEAHARDLEPEPLETQAAWASSHDADDAELVREAGQDEGDGLAGEDEIVAVRASERDVLLSWQIGDGCIDRGRALLPDADEITVRLVFFHRGEGSTVLRGERERAVQRMGEWLVADVPKDAWVTASVGLRRDDRFVSLAHSPAARAG